MRPQQPLQRQTEAYSTPLSPPGQMPRRQCLYRYDHRNSVMAITNCLYSWRLLLSTGTLQPVVRAASLSACRPRVVAAGSAGKNWAACYGSKRPLEAVKCQCLDSSVTTMSVTAGSCSSSSDRLSSVQLARL